jgi:hypothetical protein
MAALASRYRGKLSARWRHRRPAPLDFRALLIARRDDDASCRILHQGGGCSQPGGMGSGAYKLVGAADLNGDMDQALRR